MLRRCSSCHGPVSHHRETVELDRPTIYDPHNKVVVSGLGHWSCVRGCKKRQVSVVRYIGAGKEVEFKAGSDTPKDEYLRSITVNRDIIVETSRSSKRAMAASA